LWQQQSADIKSKDMLCWANTFNDLREMVKTIMTLTRESTPFQDTIAENGFYHHSFNPSQPYQLARIKLAITQNLFPEFGAGKHRLTIRFLSPEYHHKGRPTQSKQKISFGLSCCKL